MRVWGPIQRLNKLVCNYDNPTLTLEGNAGGGGREGVADACKLVNQTMDTDQMANAGGTKAVYECHRLGGGARPSKWRG